MITKPTLPQGTRDFSAAVISKRNFILETIQTVFELYGFEPLQTPALENLETLTGKYGDEGDKLLFKILNNGLDNPAKKASAESEFEKILNGRSSKVITERALRYDLTIPFARYVATNFNQLSMPFKRYQVQPVWRADRPQKGRYREFYQCDADVAGSSSLVNDAELCLLYAEVFNRLKIDVIIKINSRKILSALADLINAREHLTAITVAIDKVDKVGLNKVKEDLSGFLNTKQVATIEEYLSITGNNQEQLETAKKLFSNVEEGLTGINELEEIIDLASPGIRKTKHVTLNIDLTLARGLNYYTGSIFEVKANNVSIGSIGGGGRYDNLTGLFGLPGVAGVGISFGVDRIFDVMEELQLFPPDIFNSSRVLFFNLGKTESHTAFDFLQQLRAEGISGQLYHENAKLDKQFKYAAKKNIPFVVIIGSKELENRKAMVKAMATNTQQEVSFNDLILYLKKL